MTNERIARWLGYEIRNPDERGIVLCYVNAPGARRAPFHLPSFDTVTATWSGKGGMFDVIKARGLMDEFCYGTWAVGERPWLAEDGIDVAAALCATPAQLAAALVAVIEGESDAS